MSKGGLDKKRLTNELNPDELKEYLNEIMDAEVKKPLKEMNPDIIDECAKWLLELNGQDVEISDETIKQRAKSIIAEHYKPQIKRFNYKHMWSSAIVATACIAILMSIQLISVKAFDTNFFEWTKDKFLALIGIEAEQNNITSMVSQSKEYKTLEEFEAAENIDIIVPLWLPDDRKIKIITYSYEYDIKRVDIEYDDVITSLTIKLNANIPNTGGSEIYISSDIAFYIFMGSNAILWENDGAFYNLICGFNVREYAENIIENIK